MNLLFSAERTSQVTTEGDSGDDSEDDGERPQQEDDEDEDTAGQESAVRMFREYPQIQSQRRLSTD